MIEGALKSQSSHSFPVRLTADADAPTGVKIIALDPTLDHHRYGEWFDLIIEVE